MVEAQVKLWELYQERPFMFYQSQLYSYADFLKLIQKCRRQVAGLALPRATPMILIGDYTPQALAYIIALALEKMVVVPLSFDGKNEWPKLMKETKAQVVIDSAQEKIAVHEKQESEPLYKTLAKQNHAGLVLLTSGSSGRPKVVVHDFDLLFKGVSQKLSFIKCLPFLLFDHIGGVMTMLHVLGNCGSLAVPKSRRADDVAQTIEKFQVEMLPTTPTFLNLFLISGVRANFNLSSLKIITYGTEAMPAPLLAKLNQEFAHLKIHQTYGQSELATLKTHSESSQSVWFRPDPKYCEVKIVEGALYYRGPGVMLGHLGESQAVDSEGWYCTGDQVEVQGEYIRILGRQKDEINVGGEKVMPLEIEEALLSSGLLHQAIVYGETNALLGNIICAEVCAKDSSMDWPQLKQKLRQHCQGLLRKSKIPQKFICSTEIHHTPRYKKLAAGAESTLAQDR